jgi:NodT family efflux transporter outer membrane factor (OMF) lipoprotein
MIRPLHTSSLSLALRWVPAMAFTAFFAGCAVGPDYKRPAVAVPTAFKEAGDWTEAQPQDTQPRGPWWEIFGDDTLNQLASQVDLSNQNLKAAEARYRQAQAAAEVARAAFWPQITANASARRQQSSSRSSTLTVTPAGTPTTISALPVNLYTASLDVNWELDIWGRIRRQYESGRATAEASAADRESLRLSTQAQLVQNYFLLRAADSQEALFQDTVTAYERSLQISRNRYAAGIVTRADIVQGETQLKSTQAQLLQNRLQRAQLEHSLATLIGKPPSELTLAAAPLITNVPSVPATVPSELLQRRPDVAAAERRVIAANANVGVARAAYFPSLSLSGSGGYQSTNTSGLFSLPNRFWSVGPALAETLFAGGRLRAQSAQAIAAYDENVATYRQTVLGSFQEVEDNLAGARLLQESSRVQEEAVQAAREAVTLTMNQYKAGTISYFEVVTVQATALAAERLLVQTSGQRLTTSVTLIRALGGTWDEPGLKAALKK